MPINLHFSGWDEPIVTKVVEHLVTDRDAGPGKPLDIEDLLVVVPTRQAGRRLREALALWCENNNTALLDAHVVTPNYLFSQGLDNSIIAGAVLTRSAWIHILMQADLADMGALFPSLNNERNFQWALNTGEIIQCLRDELSDGAYSINSIIEKYGDQLEEIDRWQNLATLENLYLDELEKMKKKDLCQSKIESAKSFRLDASIKKIVVACVPDPTLLAIEALKHLAEKYPVNILVHAPKELKDTFDSWGRPETEHWRNVHIEISDWQKDVYLEGTPADQGRRVLKEISSHQNSFESGEIALGVPDRSVIPFLDKTLSAENLPPFDPADAIAGKHPVGLLAACMFSFLQTRSYQSVADLLRHPDFLRHLEKEHDLKSLKILDQLDGFQNHYLPVNLKGMLLQYKDNPIGTSEERDDFTDLGKALGVVESVLRIFEGNSFEEAWRSFYQHVYKSRQLKPANLRDAEFENAALAVDAVLREFREIMKSKVKFDVVQLASIFVRRLAEKTYHRERSNEVIDLEGWLELPWNDRPFLIVTGMNEEFVPGGSLSDTFLPDSLRSTIKLRDDASRFARDVFLMQSMIKSRAETGSTCFIVGKTATSGDPLKPSRLFFRCEDSVLPERVKKLLAETEDSHSRSYPEVVFQLKPTKAEKVNNTGEDRYISVTSFKDYLECPFRYYLKHQLGMEKTDDEKTGLDNMDFGNIVHEVLQTMGMDKKLWSSTNAKELGNKLSDLAAQQVVKRFGNPPSPFVVVSLMAAQERLRAAAQTQVDLVNEGWKIMDVETGAAKESSEKARWRFKRNGFIISGRIDRIDKHDDGRIRIIDYKTFDKRKTPESEHLVKRADNTAEYNDLVVTKQLKAGPKEEHRRWQDLQLPLYAMIYTQRTEFPDNIELAYFGLPKATSQTRIFPWNEFDEARMVSAVKCMDGVLEGIKNEVFWPPTEKIRYEDYFADLFHFEPGKAFNLDGFVK
ncbi:PD-(D/E)XK nuclease family protein [Verrucomicrobiota bacterium]